MAKPDNRSDNIEHLQSHVQNTIENLQEGEDYLAEHSDEISGAEAADIRQKNERRRESVAGFREEIKDEANS